MYIEMTWCSIILSTFILLSAVSFLWFGLKEKGCAIITFLICTIIIGIAIYEILLYY